MKISNVDLFSGKWMESYIYTHNYTYIYIYIHTHAHTYMITSDVDCFSSK